MDEEALTAMFEPQAAEPAPEQVQAPQPEQEATPQPEVQTPAPEATPQPQAQEHVVPLPKYLDTRDELKEARRRIAEFEAAKPQAQQPDPLDDPDGFRASLERQMDERLTTQRFQISDQMARAAHGAETVETALQWANEKGQTDPLFAASYMRDPNPIDWIVRQHKKDSLQSEIGDDPVAYARKIAEREGWLTQAAVAETPVLSAITQQAPKPAVPPRSLVNAPSAGGIAHQPTGLKAGVEAVFPS